MSGPVRDYDTARDAVIEATRVLVSSKALASDETILAMSGDTFRAFCRVRGLLAVLDGYAPEVAAEAAPEVEHSPEPGITVNGRYVSVRFASAPVDKVCDYLRRRGFTYAHGCWTKRAQVGQASYAEDVAREAWRMASGDEVAA